VAGSHKVESVGTIEASAGGDNCLFMDRRWPSILSKLFLGILPGLARSDRWTDIRDRFFLDLGLSGGGPGASARVTKLG